MQRIIGNGRRLRVVAGKQRQARLRRQRKRRRRTSADAAGALVVRTRFALAGNGAGVLMQVRMDIGRSGERMRVVVVMSRCFGCTTGMPIRAQRSTRYRSPSGHLNREAKQQRQQ
jgi:hypothetical protein